MMNWLSIIIVTILIEVGLCDQEEEMMKEFSARIGEQVMACRERNHFGSNVIKKFFNYWKKEFPLNDTKMGCVIKCVVDRLEVIDVSGQVKGDNVEAFFSANGSDEPTSRALADLIRLCKSATKASDGCVAALELALCFKTGIAMIGWTPDLHDVAGNEDTENTYY